ARAESRDRAMDVRRRVEIAALGEPLDRRAIGAEPDLAFGLDVVAASAELGARHPVRAPAVVGARLAVVVTRAARGPRGAGGKEVLGLLRRLRRRVDVSFRMAHRRDRRWCARARRDGRWRQY